MGTRSNELLITTRGTATLRDWLTDFNIGQQKGPSGLMVHAGFNDSFNSFKDDIDRHRNKVGCSGTVHCVGHSLGGALATLTADYLTAKGVSDVKLYTFGCPRVGTKSFSQNLTSHLKSENIHRVYHEADPVSMIPIFPFAHLDEKDAGYILPWNGMNVSFFAHMMDKYISSVGKSGWYALPKPIPSVKMEEQIEAFLSSPSAGPMFNNARVLWMIGKAINWILKKAGMAVGAALTGAVTVLDKIAWLLTEAAHKTKELSLYVGSLVKSLFAFLGRTIQKGVNITVAFLRWALGLLFSSIGAAVTTAIATAHSVI